MYKNLLISSHLFVTIIFFSIDRMKRRHYLIMLMSITHMSNRTYFITMSPMYRNLHQDPLVAKSGMTFLLCINQLTVERMKEYLLLRAKCNFKSNFKSIFFFLFYFYFLFCSILFVCSFLDSWWMIDKNCIKCTCTQL